MKIDARAVCLAVISCAGLLALLPAGTERPTGWWPTGHETIAEAETRRRVEKKATAARTNPRPFDDPDEAYAYYRQKRIGRRDGGNEDMNPQGAYARARVVRERTPRFGILYATYATFGRKHVWKSEDAGASWSSIDGTGVGALPDLPVHSVAVDPDRPKQLFLGTDLGFFVSPDGGSTWGVEAGGLPAAVTEWIQFLETPRGERYLFAFTHGRGAWRLRLGG